MLKKNLFVAFVSLFISCGGKGDIHPDYPTIYSMTDSVGYPLKRIAMEGDNMQSVNFLTTEKSDIQYFEIIEYSGNYYYFSESKIAQDRDSFKKYLLYYDDKGCLSSKICLADLIPNRAGVVLTDERSINNAYVIYNEIARLNDRQVIYLFDFDKNTIQDSIFVLDRTDFVQRIDKDFHAEANQKHPYYWEEQAEEHNRAMDLIKQNLLPFPFVKTKAPYIDNTKKDSLSLALFDNEVSAYNNTISNHFEKYVNSLIDRYKSQLYYLKLDKEQWLIFDKMKLAISLSYVPVEQWTELKSYIDTVSYAKKPLIEGDLVLLKTDSVLHSRSEGRGRLSLWEDNILNYYALMHKNDTICHFKSDRDVELHSSRRHGKDYVIILKQFNEYLFFRYILN